MDVQVKGLGQVLPAPHPPSVGQTADLERQLDRGNLNGSGDRVPNSAGTGANLRGVKKNCAIVQ